MKLSIINPVYKVEHTLNQCIESVLEQSFTDYEILLIDDGSPDNCPQICDQWTEQDNRLKVIHKPNGGLSDARNAGIDKAQGEYITFIDSDDTIEKDTLSEIMNAFTLHPVYQIIEYPVSVHHHSDRAYILHFEEKGYTNLHDYWISHKGYTHAYAWNKVYHRKLFTDIRFPVGKLFEDIITVAKLLKLSGNILTISRGRYNYYENKNGLTALAGKDDLKQLLLWHLQIRREYIQPQNESTKNNIRATHDRARYELYLVNIQLDIYRMGNTTPYFTDCHIPFGFLFTQNLSIIMRGKALIIQLFGIKTLCRIHLFAHKLIKKIL
mgnify:FL=1